MCNMIMLDDAKTELLTFQTSIRVTQKIMEECVFVQLTVIDKDFALDNIIQLSP